MRLSLLLVVILLLHHHATVTETHNQLVCFELRVSLHHGTASVRNMLCWHEVDLLVDHVGVLGVARPAIWVLIGIFMTTHATINCQLRLEYGYLKASVSYLLDIGFELLVDSLLPGEVVCKVAHTLPTAAISRQFQFEEISRSRLPVLSRSFLPKSKFFISRLLCLSVLTCSFTGFWGFGVLGF